MKINANYAERVVLATEAMQWVPSPMAGVDRKMLDRVGDEVARATSLVRYAPESHFSAHTHGGGEEFLVLEGTFSDQFDDYPAGTYVRNPPGSQHSPHSLSGCVIFVKLWQFSATDSSHVVVRSDREPFSAGSVPGLTVLPLHVYGDERISMLRMAPATAGVAVGTGQGEEILVLQGTLQDEQGSYPKGTWIRSPRGHYSTLSSAEGCQVLLRTGHL